MKWNSVLFFAIVSFQAVAQGPQVPHKMKFAGISLTIREDARREIQKDVDALTQSPKHFNIKAERAKTYFPIIEKIFAEEGVPDDFKYLVLQESALIADAVSTSNAVGFWQFKDFTAIEMGLRVDKEIDERLNIASSTRAAARYLKKNNEFFDNWLYALQSYQMGAGGVLKSLKEDHHGETHAEINSSTYWYVKKFLAYKIAFEQGTAGQPKLELLVYENKKRKTLADLAGEVDVPETDLRNYNKWTKSGNIPDDRTYVVLIPAAAPVTSVTALNADASPGLGSSELAAATSINTLPKTVRSKVNGIATIQAAPGENAAALAARAGVDLASFLKWNDIDISHKLIPHGFYLLGKKRVRAEEAFHKAKPGETLWLISQLYGVQIKKLKKYNRLDSETFTAGSMLWLASMKPKSAGNDNTPAVAAEVSNKESFSWTAGTEQPAAETTLTQPVSLTVQTEPVNDSAQYQVEASIAQPPVIMTTADQPDTAQQKIKIEVPANIELPEGKRVHTVQAGETLYAIAKIYGVGVMDLVHWNNLDLQQDIKPGQVLKLSDNQTLISAVASPKELTHEVKPSDTLYSIARQYGVTIKELMEWNGKKNFSLSVGEKLKVIQAQ